ncbi:hypothetical protein JMJ77_0012261 [Colletotrichum scovillei]|uniref:Uncharacterized protein n=1 Tax=Colletotrichum scovillei TaxID=1209932 RepID=A0A9P7U6T8_9PEZI|nr:hypothetical protein JMJ78_0001313 [Colletotrichum scovillei]KAG7041743.1 hypothetical protein JMJ77_0012261 [Colletotrichum scovillei]KAG7061772.1 hypothetical protein JMJ76_0003729 [Colletotrichum scovillei]
MANSLHLPIPCLARHRTGRFAANGLPVLADPAAQPLSLWIEGSTDT